MAKQMEFFNINTRKGRWSLRRGVHKIRVNLAIGHEHGAKLHLDRARKCGASEDEVGKQWSMPSGRLPPRCATSPRIFQVRRETNAKNS